MNMTTDKHKSRKPKKDKKLMKLITGSEREHELSYYLNDRVKLMKEVIRILKPKKIKSMAPQCMKSLSYKEINSMLLEELLGISNKRVKRILNGQPQDDDSSSTDEDEVKSIISLDDVSEDELVIDLDSDVGNTATNKNKTQENSKMCKKTKIKKEKKEKKYDKNTNEGTKVVPEQEQLMSVLELLELQARARAIRSQLALESKRKAEGKEQLPETEKTLEISDNDETAVIIEGSNSDEIVISSSDSENDLSESIKLRTNTESKNNKKCNPSKTNNLENNLSQNNNSTSEIICGNDIESGNESAGKIVSEISSENTEDINKLLNKFQKIKKLKRKSGAHIKNLFENLESQKRRHTENHVNSELLIREKERPEYENQMEKSTSSIHSQECSKESDQTAESFNTDLTRVREERNRDEDDVIVISVESAELNLDPEHIGSSKGVIDSPTDIGNILEHFETSNKKINTQIIENSSVLELTRRNIQQEHFGEDSNADECDRIILNVDQAEMDSVSLDSIL